GGAADRRRGGGELRPGPVGRPAGHGRAAPARPPHTDPVPDPARGRRGRPGHGGRHGARAAARARPGHLPAAAPVLGGLLLLPAGPAGQRAPDRAAGRRRRVRHRPGRRRGGPRDHPRPELARRVHARRGPEPDGPRGRHGDRLARRRAPALRHRGGGRVARQRLHGPHRLPLRDRGDPERDVLPALRRPDVPRRRRGRRGDRDRRRGGRRRRAPPHRGRADGDHHLAADAVLRLPAGRGPGGQRRPGRRHRGHLARLALAAAHHAADPDPGLRLLGDPRLHPQRGAVHPRGAPAPDGARADLGRLLARGARGLRGGDHGDARRGALPVGLSRHVPAAQALPVRARAGSQPAVDEPVPRGVHRHARRGVPGGGARHPGGDGHGRAVPPARPDHLPRLRRDPRDRGGPGARARADHPAARGAGRRGRRPPARGPRAPARRPRRHRPHRRGLRGGLGAPRERRAAARPVRVPRAPLHRPLRRGRPGGDRGRLHGLPAPAPRGPRRRAPGDHPPAQHGRDQRRAHAPHRARPRPGGRPARRRPDL
ncbi:MAG: Na+/H+ antiporter, partial [uncultured Solirubrobacteraceae bacterium]